VSFVRALVACSLLTIPLSSCVVKLSDLNSPEVNGGVTGQAMNCRGAQVLARGAPGGAAEIKYVGRFTPKTDDQGNPVAGQMVFDWSGTNISVRVQGTSKVIVKLLLPDTIPQDQMFEFIVDKLTPEVRQITVTTDPKTKLPTNTPQIDYEIKLPNNSPHEITIWKNTEAQKGSVIFQGFDLQGGTMLPPTRRPRKIEVIGDSIICGYGMLGLNATCPFEIEVRKARTVDNKLIDITVPITESNYLSFTSQTARNLDADITTYCWSGKGVSLNYKEEKKPDATGALIDDVDARVLMPELYEKRTIASDPQLANDAPYDFTKEPPDSIPQVVFISLGTNDFSRDELPTHPDHPDQLPGDNVPDGDLEDPVKFNTFYQDYANLVTFVRQNRPQAHIFLATPPMLTDQFPLPNARTQMRSVLDHIVSDHTRAGDTKVYAMDLVEMGFRYGLGCDYHPNLQVHQIMAQQLTGAIQSKTCWK
jgi:lysophospholipase L1-like esterase